MDGNNHGSTTTPFTTKIIPTVPDWYLDRLHNITRTTTRDPHPPVILHGGSPITYAGLEEVGVPLAVTLLVVVILCVVIAYVKSRRRAAAEAANGRSDLNAMAGGAPTNVGAYMNYNSRVAERQRERTPAHSPPEVQSPPYYISDAPPSYEDSIRYADGCYSSGLVNMGFAASQANITGASDLGNLPVYPPAYSVQESQEQVPRPLAIVQGSVTSEPHQSGTDLPHQSSQNSQDTQINDTNNVNKPKNEADVVRDALIQGPKPDANQDSQGAASEEEASSSENCQNEAGYSSDPESGSLDPEPDNSVSGPNCPIPGPDSPILGPECPIPGEDSPVPARDSPVPGRVSPIPRPDNPAPGPGSRHEREQDEYENPAVSNSELC